MLRKHAAKFGAQWDCYLPGVLWAYRNTPHDVGLDLHSPTEAALAPTAPLQPTEVEDFREELVLSLCPQPGSWLPTPPRALFRFISYVSAPVLHICQQDSTGMAEPWQEVSQLLEEKIPYRRSLHQRSLHLRNRHQLRTPHPKTPCHSRKMPRRQLWTTAVQRSSSSRLNSLWKPLPRTEKPYPW